MRKNMNKKILSITLAFSLISGSIAIQPGWVIASQTDVARVEISPAHNEVESITNTSEYDSNEIIVQYKDGITDVTSDISNIEVENEIELTEDTSLIEVENRAELKETIQELSQDPNVEYIQPNYTKSLLGISNDSYIDEQWAYNNLGMDNIEGIQETAGIDINLGEAWGLLNNNTEKIVVAVVDTGIDYDHIDLADHIWTNPGEIADNGVDDDKNGFVDDVHGWNFYDDTNEVCNDELYYNGQYRAYETEEDHGTHVAGIISATSDNGTGVAGIASKINVEIMPVKALGGINGQGTTSSIVQAIQYAEDMGADICNLSIGGSDYDLLELSVLEDSDMLFVAAAGNGNSAGVGYNIDANPVYPACYDLDNIISVANISCDGNLHSSSNYGVSNVDIAAPGTDILSTIVDATQSGKRPSRYAFYTGTSMAAPMVSGVAALVAAYHPGFTKAQIKKAIIESSQKLSNISNKIVSGGMLDAYGALAYDVQEPIIDTKVSVIKNSNYKTLKVNVTSQSKTISKVLYAAGTKSASYFQKGAVGTALTLTNGAASVKITKNGNYTIYAVDSEGNESVRTQAVRVLSVTKVKLSASQKTIAKGKTYTIKTTLSPASVVSKLTYKSSNTKVATVSSTGKVTGKSRGTAQITVTASNGVKSICKVTIK